MTEWDREYIKQESFPIGFQHSYADTMVGIVRTGLAIVGVMSIVFAIGFCAGYFWGAR